MAWVDDDRQVGLLFDDWNGRDVQCVAGSGLKGADAALAQDNLFVAAGHDVFCAHQQLFDGVGKSALEQDGLVYFAQLLEQLKVLHIACADLNDVHLFKQRQMVDAHDFGDNGQTGCFFGFQQVIQPFLAQSLEGVWGGARLECAATQQSCAGSLDRIGYRNHLLTTFHRAGTGDDLKMSAADFSAADIDDGVVRVEFAVGIFIGLLDSFDFGNGVHRFDVIGVQTGGITNQSEDGFVYAANLLHLKIHLLEVTDHFIDLNGGSPFF